MIDHFNPVVYAILRAQLLQGNTRLATKRSQMFTSHVDCCFCTIHNVKNGAKKIHQYNLNQTLRRSKVIINSEGLGSVGLVEMRGAPRPNIPFNLSFTDSLLGCLFMIRPIAV